MGAFAFASSYAVAQGFAALLEIHGFSGLVGVGAGWSATTIGVPALVLYLVYGRPQRGKRLNLEPDKRPRPSA